MQKDEKTLQINGFVGFFVFFAERKEMNFPPFYPVVISGL